MRCVTMVVRMKQSPHLLQYLPVHLSSFQVCRFVNPIRITSAAGSPMMCPKTPLWVCWGVISAVAAGASLGFGQFARRRWPCPGTSSADRLIWLSTGYPGGGLLASFTASFASLSSRSAFLGGVVSCFWSSLLVRWSFWLR